MTDEIMEGQVSIFDRDTWFGKMYPEPCQVTKAKTSDASSKKQPKSSKKMPLYLNLRKADGVTAEPLWETGGALLGEYTMHSFGECPNEENESHLSQILQEQVPPKYSLSAKACQGILNRASKRGKELPKILREALENQVQRNEEELH